LTAFFGVDRIDAAGKVWRPHSIACSRIYIVRARKTPVQG